MTGPVLRNTDGDTEATVCQWARVWNMHGRNRWLNRLFRKRPPSSVDSHWYTHLAEESRTVLGETLEPKAYFDRLAEGNFANLISLRWQHFRTGCTTPGSIADGSSSVEMVAQQPPPTTLPRTSRRESSGKKIFAPIDAAVFRSVSLAANISWLSALGNDMGYDQVFVQQLGQLW
ncbi:MAG: hypothetical protein KatS3mg112_0517 [Thermogutta sp.]|nr:MAG: hypothetical protein KatS3mg112_0517 [Thermogutta sp.]